ncbi:Uncharacterised protein [Vibrio cholerae]|nr:Uncharacterised protein [Vibrio cholerae]
MDLERSNSLPMCTKGTPWPNTAVAKLTACMCTRVCSGSA